MSEKECNCGQHCEGCVSEELFESFDLEKLANFLGWNFFEHECLGKTMMSRDKFPKIMVVSKGPSILVISMRSKKVWHSSVNIYKPHMLKLQKIKSKTSETKKAIILTDEAAVTLWDPDNFCVNLGERRQQKDLQTEKLREFEEIAYPLFEEFHETRTFSLLKYMDGIISTKYSDAIRKIIDEEWKNPDDFDVSSDKQKIRDIAGENFLFMRSYAGIATPDYVVSKFSLSESIGCHFVAAIDLGLGVMEIYYNDEKLCKKMEELAKKWEDFTKNPIKIMKMY